MSDPHATTTAEVMVETDLRGADSHGISMLPTYEFRSGRLNMRPVFKTVREGPAMALVDADASLGHPVSVNAMNLAVDKSLTTGVAVVSLLLEDRGGPRRDRHGHIRHPWRDHGAHVRRGTGDGHQPPGVRRAGQAQSTLPARHGDDDRRRRQDQGEEAQPRAGAGGMGGRRRRQARDRRNGRVRLRVRSAGRRHHPLGGTRGLGSHKGYGLAVLVHILAGTLSGASFSPIRNRTQRASDPHNIGHFFMAIDPRAFREDGAFENDLDQVIGSGA
jgi:hypothetical protein